MSNKRKDFFEDCGVEKFNFHSDHRLFQCKLYIKGLRRFKSNIEPRPGFIINENNELEYQNYLNQNFSNINLLTEIHSEIIKATRKVKSNITETKKGRKRLPKDIRSLKVKREKLRQF